MMQNGTEQKDNQNEDMTERDRKRERAEGGGERWMEGWLVGGFGWRVGEKTRDREIRFHPLQTDSARLLTL